jgi:SPP1 gp7 family putative phage head morphogenesis protein
MPEAVPFSLPFDEATAFFQQKGFRISPASWRDVWQQEHARAFTVARVTAMDVLQDIKAEVDKALSTGVSLDEFKKNLIPMLERKGWWAKEGEAAKALMPDGTIRKRLQPWRLETIWRTNIQTSYATGRYQQQMEVAAHRPYWQYKAIMDSRTRPAHAAMNGKVYRHDDPVWKTWYPPNGFGCRCYIKTLSDHDLHARGLRPDTEPPDGFQPDEGWRYNVGEAGVDSGWSPRLGQYPALVKQQFLDELLDHTCPDDWADFAESQCYKRLKKKLTQGDLEDLETLIWARKEGGIEGYGDWVNEVLNRPRDSAVRGEIYPAGNIPLKVLTKLKEQPRLALVVVDDNQLNHLFHDKASGRALTIEEIEDIPLKFNDSDWYFDQKDPALLMTWIRMGSKMVKIVVRTDIKVGRGIANKIVTGGIVEEWNVTMDARYEKL